MSKSSKSKRNSKSPLKPKQSQPKSFGTFLHAPDPSRALITLSYVGTVLASVEFVCEFNSPSKEDIRTFLDLADGFASPSRVQQLSMPADIAEPFWDSVMRALENGASPKQIQSVFQQVVGTAVPRS